MSITYLRQLPKTVIFDDLSIPTKDRVCVMDRKTMEQINDYTRSSPTSPSPGRVYRKCLNWNEDRDDQVWWIYKCERDPEDEKYVLHHPYRWVDSADFLK